MSSNNPAGRPAGVTKQRLPIDLPDGDRLIPYFTTFSKDTGLHPKYLQRIRHRMPTVVCAGVVYVKDKAGREALANPPKRRARR
jgi:hypothetical protein